MDLCKCGELLRSLRLAGGMTQKQVAEKLGVMPKTVSKWETGRGFPDVSVVSALADVLGVSERIILSGNLTQSPEEVGNMRKTKFYVCPNCGNVMQGTGVCRIICCGKPLEQLIAQSDESHIINVEEIENDYYIDFNHEMTKEHYIRFVAFIGVDRVLTVRLYPEQNPTVRIPRMARGKLCYYCNKHGLFEYKI